MLLVLLVRVLVRVDLALVLRLMRHAGPALVLILFPFPLAMSIDTFAWRLLFETLGRKMRWWGLLRIRLSSEAVLMSLPLGMAFAESLNLFLLRRLSGVPAADGIAVAIGKKWLFLRAHALYVALSAVVGYRVLARHSHALIGAPGLPWLVLASAMVPFAFSTAMAATLGRGSIARALGHLLPWLRIEWLRRWTERRARGFAETDANLARIASERPFRVHACTALFLGAWLMESVETLLILRVLGTHVDFVDVLSFEAGLSLIRSLAFFAPSGLGVQDLGYLAAFSALGITDAMAVGAAFVLLKRMKELLFIGIGYGMLFAGEAVHARWLRANPPGRASPGGETVAACSIVKRAAAVSARNAS